MFGGSLSEAFAEKICKVMDLALRNGAPVIGLNDSGGARIQEGVVSLGGYADIFLRNTLASGVIPQISAILGPCAGGAVYSPAITDFIVHGARHVVHVRDRAQRGEDGDARRRHDGAARRRRHARRPCPASRTSRTTPSSASLQAIRELFRFIPSNNLERSAARHAAAIRATGATRSLLDVVPDNANKPYDMHDVIRRIVDDGEFYEVQRDYAGNILCGFAHLGGYSVGIVANQPAVLAGVLDINARVKAARFVRFCDASTSRS